MNKNNLILGIAVFILLSLTISGYFYFNKNNSENITPIENNETSTTTNNSMKDKETLSSSRYIEFSSDILSNIESKRILFFYANWCPLCRPADKEFQENSDKIPTDIKIIRVNYNDTDTDQAEKDLAKKYNITYQHTFVQIDKNANEVTRWNGGGLDDLLTNIK